MIKWKSILRFGIELTIIIETLMHVRWVEFAPPVYLLITFFALGVNYWLKDMLGEE